MKTFSITFIILYVHAIHRSYMQTWYLVHSQTDVRAISSCRCFRFRDEVHAVLVKTCTFKALEATLREKHSDGDCEDMLSLVHLSDCSSLTLRGCVLKRTHESEGQIRGVISVLQGQHIPVKQEASTLRAKFSDQCHACRSSQFFNSLF